MTKLIVEDRIDRPPKDVFEAIVSPESLSAFFTAEASAAMVPGTTVTWRFGHVDAAFDVEIGDVEADRLITWRWPGSEVTVELADEGGATRITITEDTVGDGPDGAARAVGQTQGWVYFVCALRAWLLHGIRHFGLSGAIRVTLT
ncbi:hypothetical protein GTW43_27955 [Streptomyces sp. SID5785]|uniref:SRPBCC domain-containing protein n=1 Tax=Streptomyces sp. SID5785 TaxID=2690309 RepID=UPI001361ECF5|nr:SRPBCC domain-containing protein [Streptomyces sp. SID5785]MZD08881.1 hypothetical protein [Streptomyces sp. SID5785]